MCLAIPARILSVDGALGNVDIMGVEKTVNLQLIENPVIGDYILVHSGCGIQKIDSNYFNYLQEVFKDILDRQDIYG